MAQPGPSVVFAIKLCFVPSEVCNVCENLARTEKPSLSPSHRRARARAPRRPRSRLPRDSIFRARARRCPLRSRGARGPETIAQTAEWSPNHAASPARHAWPDLRGTPGARHARRARRALRARRARQRLSALLPLARAGQRLRGEREKPSFPPFYSVQLHAACPAQHARSARPARPPKPLTWRAPRAPRKLRAPWLPRPSRAPSPPRALQ